MIDPGPVIDGHLDAIEGAAPPGRTRSAGCRDPPPPRPRAGRPGAGRADRAPSGRVRPRRGGRPRPRASARGPCSSGPGFRAPGAPHPRPRVRPPVLAARGARRSLFSGDHVMQGSTVVIRPPDGNMADVPRQPGRLLVLDRRRSRRSRRATAASSAIRRASSPRSSATGSSARQVVAAALAAAGPCDRRRARRVGLRRRRRAARLGIACDSLWAHLQKLALDGRAAVLARRAPTRLLDARRREPGCGWALGGRAGRAGRPRPRCCSSSRAVQPEVSITGATSSATTRASSANTAASSPSPSATGAPASPPAAMSGWMGTVPTRGTPISAASRSPPPAPNSW